MQKEMCIRDRIKRILGELGGSYDPGWSHNGRELEQQGIPVSYTHLSRATLPAAATTMARISSRRN